MRQISRWAKDHVWTSRLLIIFVFYPLLNLGGWFLGAAFFWDGVELPSWTNIVSLALVILLFIHYPARFKKSVTYWRRKTFDLLLISTTFLLIIFTGNRYSSSFTNAPVTSSFASSSSSPDNILPANKSKKQKEKFLKRWIKKIENKYRAAKAPNKALYIVLTVVVACLLIYLLGALTCSVACAGSEGAAYVILFVGLAAIIFGVVRTIKRINNGPRKKPEEKPVGN